MDGGELNSGAYAGAIMASSEPLRDEADGDFPSPRDRSRRNLYHLRVQRPWI